MSQQGLFPTPDVDRPRQSETLSTAERRAVDRPRWARYRPVNRVQCSECVLVLHENGGVGSTVLGARWRYSLDKEVWYLCDPHAILRRGVP